jgi:hypothetical protein
MNRLELALLLICILFGVLLTIRSRWFDRVLDWAFKTNHIKSPSPHDDNPPPPSSPN